MKTPDDIARDLVRVAAHADQQAWVELAGVRVPLLLATDAEKMRGIVRRLVEQVRADGAAAEPSSGHVPYGSPAAAAATWSVRTGRPCPVTARWCSCGHSVARQGKPIDRCGTCGGFCEGSEWR